MKTSRLQVAVLACFLGIAGSACMRGVFAPSPRPSTDAAISDGVVEDMLLTEGMLRDAKKGAHDAHDRDGAACACDAGCVDNGSGQCLPVAGTEGPASSSTCRNGLDDDGDGLIDLEDSECWDVSNFSSVFPALIGSSGLGKIDLTGAKSPVTINGDVGSVVDGEGHVLRHAGTGLHDGVRFQLLSQDDVKAPIAAVFVASSLELPAGLLVRGAGSKPLVLLLRGDATIRGLIDVGARRPASARPADGDTIPGPGGDSGGGPGHAGAGPGAGQVGSQVPISSAHGAAGGGGAGHGALGGKGGDALDDKSKGYAGGAAGPAYGSSTCRPLRGGSGGAGGRREHWKDPEEAGAGGAGGGALQISAGGMVTIARGGGIIAPGGGGGGAPALGSGGGGGSGGTILIEATLVVVEGGAWLNANGGGGGSGDCI